MERKELVRIIMGYLPKLPPQAKSPVREVTGSVLKQDFLLGSQARSRFREVPEILISKVKTFGGDRTMAAMYLDVAITALAVKIGLSVNHSRHLNRYDFNLFKTWSMAKRLKLHEIVELPGHMRKAVAVKRGLSMAEVREDLFAVLFQAMAELGRKVDLDKIFLPLQKKRKLIDSMDQEMAEKANLNKKQED